MKNDERLIESLGAFGEALCCRAADTDRDRLEHEFTQSLLAITDRWGSTLHWDGTSQLFNQTIVGRLLVDRFKRGRSLYEWYGIDREALATNLVNDLVNTIEGSEISLRCNIVLSGVRVADDVRVSTEQGIQLFLGRPDIYDMEKLELILADRMSAQVNGTALVRAMTRRPVTWTRADEVASPTKGFAKSELGRLAELTADSCRVAKFPSPSIVAGYMDYDGFFTRDGFEGWSDFLATTRERAKLFECAPFGFGGSIAMTMAWEAATDDTLIPDEVNHIAQLVSPKGGVALAVTRYSSALRRRNSTDMLLDLAIALENCLRRPDDRNTSHLSGPDRLAFVAADTMKRFKPGLSLTELLQISSAVKDMYKRRNALAHGSSNSDDVSVEEVTLVRDLIIASADLRRRNDWPSVSDSIMAAIAPKNLG